MPPRNRPTAFEVSFGSDDSPAPSIALRRDAVSSNSPFAKHPSPSSSTGKPSSSASPRPGAPRNGPSALNAVPASSRDAGGRHRASAADGGVAREKRKGEGREERPSPRPEKRAKPGPTTRTFFDVNAHECIKETRSTVIMGEDLDDLADGDKPVRALTHFVIFDPRAKELISLDELYAGAAHRQYEAFGTVTPVFANEEDAGQDDDYESSKRDRFVQRLRTSAIFNFMVDYSGDDSLYIQTEYAWYALKTPLPLYREIWLKFYRPHRITQLAISQAIQLPKASWGRIKQTITQTRIDDEVKECFDWDEVEDAKALVLDALSTESVKENNQYRAALDSKLYTDLSEGRTQPSTTFAPRVVLRAPMISSKLFHNNDLDLAVLRPENQHKTTVTPFILLLSDGLFRENLKVLGTVPKFPKEKDRYTKLLLALQKAQRVLRDPCNVVFPRNARWSDQYYKSVLLNGVEYKAGDYVMVPASAYPGRLQHEIPAIVDRDTVPKERTLADYFWFARIIYFNQEAREMHIQWMEHSSKTLMQEIHDPRELFLTDICNDLPIEIIEKVDVRRIDRPLLDFPKYKDPVRENCRFYYSFSYNQKDGTFKGINDVPSGFLQGLPPDNCPNCMRTAQGTEENYPQGILDGHGISYRGIKYHINDFAMFKTNDVICAIGQIIQFNFATTARAQGACMVGVQLLGRISDIAHLYSGRGSILKDERHLFLTSEIVQFDSKQLLRRCRVLNHASLSDPTFTRYLEQSPYNFYVEYAFPDTRVRNWHNARRLSVKEPEICRPCYLEESKSTRDLDDFLRDRGQLRAFDPFAGVGAFALAMQEAGCLKLTHAVEISPSAARTLKKNSPETVVYNQCSNVILEHAVKKRYLDDVVSKDITITNIGDGSPIPPPPRPEDIDCLVAGFPCQPHSRLNMFQKANDVKSHLMLNLLSWVEFLKPRFCFFENVRGFLQYGINGNQASRYKVQGGIAAGGVKFIVHAMVAMGYQVRFATLQSAHYGTPQTRVRFFLIAARLGEPMPSFPTPLYAFPVKDALEFKLPHGLVVHPIHIEAGTAPFRHITVDDAIGDLPRFDWMNPRKPSQRCREDPETHERVEVAKCDKVSGRSVCRPDGRKAGGYHYSPRTLYQMKARVRESSVQDLQHFTRVLKEETVARVVLIPLEARADYLSLFKDKDVPPELLEWQFADPKSAVARLGFRKGLYGRLDKDGYFQTTVTNVEPTAKQSWVLNPYCKRVVTVRELARSQGFPDHFQFHCYSATNVKTMQREIGNAVPWPVGYALGLELRDALFERWLEARSNAIVIDGSDD